jgi:ATP-dependent Clp protease ATP-binding subunit ClpA
MRPDKAIDALDEACAHMQAVIAYSAATEALIQRRVALFKDLARVEREESRRKPERGTREPANAFERFGAELEALFVGAPAPVGAAEPIPSPQPADRQSRPEALAPLEAELSRQLMEEGIVVRGHDVARVVGLMAGTEVAWSADDTP